MVFTVASQKFDVDEKYVPIENQPIGHGAYGVVCAVVNQETGERVAIKKISKAFDDLTDAKRILREIRLLRHLKHENVIAIKDLCVADPPGDDVYLFMDLMDTDLHKVIHSPQPLIDDHCQFFLYQLLRALKYIHAVDVLHRDLKPGNLLVNSNCDLKICDFGLARLGANSTEENPIAMTTYVVTRWYRAPEVLYTKEYTAAIDLWSVGCIFAELLGRKPLFQGKNYKHQLTVIFDIIGRPTSEDLQVVDSEKVREFLGTLGVVNPPPMSSIFPEASPEALDLLTKLLYFHPSKRITAEQALKHPYLAEYYDPEEDEEPVTTESFEFEFEDTVLTKAQIEAYMREEMYRIHPEARARQQAKAEALK